MVKFPNYQEFWASKIKRSLHSEAARGKRLESIIRDCFKIPSGSAGVSPA